MAGLQQDVSPKLQPRLQEVRRLHGNRKGYGKGIGDGLQPQRGSLNAHDESCRFSSVARPNGSLGDGDTNSENIGQSAPCTKRRTNNSLRTLPLSVPRPSLQEPSSSSKRRLSPQFRIMGVSKKRQHQTKGTPQDRKRHDRQPKDDVHANNHFHHFSAKDANGGPVDVPRNAEEAAASYFNFVVNQLPQERPKQAEGAEGTEVNFPDKIKKDEHDLNSHTKRVLGDMKALVDKLVFKAMRSALDLEDPTELAVAAGPTLIAARD